MAVHRRPRVGEIGRAQSTCRFEDGVIEMNLNLNVKLAPALLLDFKRGVFDGCQMAKRWLSQGERTKRNSQQRTPVGVLEAAVKREGHFFNKKR